MKKFGIIAMAVSVISLCISVICMVFTFQNSVQPKSDSDTTTQFVMYVGTNDKDTLLTCSVHLCQKLVNARHTFIIS